MAPQVWMRARHLHFGGRPLGKRPRNGWVFLTAAESKGLETRKRRGRDRPTGAYQHAEQACRRARMHESGGKKNCGRRTLVAWAAGQPQPEIARTHLLMRHWCRQDAQPARLPPAWYRS